MDIHVQQGKPRTITGEFMCSQHEPVSDKTTNAARRKKISKLPSRCELDCVHGSLSIYLLSTCSLLLTLSNICKVTRNKHDKEYFCLEYGTEKDPFLIFLTILDNSDADDWEYELCKITGQTPPRRRRLKTGVRPKRPIRGNTLSSPGAPQGFSLGGEEEYLDDVPAEGDDGDGAEDDKQNDGALPTSHSGSHEEETSTRESTRTSSSDGHQETEVVVTVTPPELTSSDDGQQDTEETQVTQAQAELQETRPRDGQREPVESHIGEVIGFENVSPTPGHSPINRLSHASDENQDKDRTEETLVIASQSLEKHEEQLKKLGQQKQEFPLDDEKPSDIPTSANERISSEIGTLQSLDQRPDQPPDELPSTEVASHCTYMEIECSQEESFVEVNKEDFLSAGIEINDIFVCYRGSVYLKSCPEILQHMLFIGTRIKLVNNQEPFSADRAIDYIMTSAGKTVNLLVQLFPLGVRVQIRVKSLADLGVKLYGNEITGMNEDGVMSKIADGLRCVSPALSTPDTPLVEQRSITAIGDRHVPLDATANEVEDMLNAAINNGNGLVVLQLHPKEFCQAIAPDALQRRLQEDAVLNPRPTRKLSLARSLMSNPPS